MFLMLCICSAQHQHRLDQVEGSLEVFQSHSKLKVLDVEGTTVEGSIEVFQNTPSLQILNMADTLGRVSGNIEVFEHTKDLEVLRLNATELVGDMRVFRFTQGLRELNLVNALEVTANLLELLGNYGTFKNLEKLVITNSGRYLHGSVSDFLTAKKLQVMHIENAARIDSDLTPLFFPSLRRLILKGIEMFYGFTEMDQEFTQNVRDKQFSLSDLSELHLEPKVEKTPGRGFKFGAYGIDHSNGVTGEL